MSNSNRSTGALSFLSAALLVSMLASPVGAQFDESVWVGEDGSFTDPDNWDPEPPFDNEGQAIVNNGGTVTIDAADDETFAFAGFQLGQIEDETGHVVMNGGVLLLGEFESGATHIGDQNADAGPDGSTYILNGGELVFGPVRGFGFVDDWEIGESGFGRMEVHNDAIFRIHDDLKLGAGAAGNGTFVIDGNATLTVGSGISVSEGGGSTGTLIIRGNATVDSGNSLGAGHPEGTSNEGYLTLSVSSDATATVVVEENARLRIRTLAERGGTSTMTVKDDAEFHIFDVLAGEGDPEAEFESYAGNRPGVMQLTLQDNAVMTVQSALRGLLWGGGGRDPGTNDVGGTAILTVRDNASFLSLAGALNLGIGNTASSEGILEVIGPDATVEISGDLLLNPDDTIDEEGNEARGVLRAVITAASHTTVAVDGTVNIENGELEVEFSGYEPVHGDRWTLVTGDIMGEFRNEALPEPESGVSLALEYDGGSVMLVATGAGVGPFIRGDCNSDNNVDQTDAIFLLAALFLGNAEPQCQAACDFDGSGARDVTDAVFLLATLFLGQGPIPPPTGTAGLSERPEDLALGCAAPQA